MRIALTDEAQRVMAQMRTLAMTAEEYVWWRNEWLKSASEIRLRVVRSDRVFYGRKAA